MTIKPIAQNPQVQPLTVVLRNICRDYPAGGGVLHELLQNADDAGATIVRFFLDQKTYSTSDLIDPELAGYQGPALLAYNNAVFTENDFRSLGRLGDSLKIDDGSTTGKFGRGFNSVYNWTDSPSIISGCQFLILDPHHAWSDGGPVYDFVATAGEPVMKSQMEAFESVMANVTQPFDGTIIRIPLRTSAQAKTSNIVNRETAVSDVLDVLRKFADNFGASGLLFLRNIEQIHIESSAALSIRLELLNCDELKAHRQKVRLATKSALSCSNFKFEHSFELQVERRDAQQVNRTNFVVHHSIQNDGKDEKLQEWMEEQKLVPWVAVAAQIPFENSFCGSLYTVLPLPIPSSQPIHMHGLFSLSPNRARLHQGGSNIQDNNPGNWNNMLFRVALPSAWTSLLGHISQCKPSESPFAWWPKEVNDSSDLYNNMIGDFMDVVASKSLPLWPTDMSIVEACSRHYETHTSQSFTPRLTSNESLLIRYRSEADFKNYCLEYVFKDPRATDDAILLKAEDAEFVSRSWLWFEARQVDILNTNIADLWLLPLTNGKYRRIKPQNQPSMTLLAPVGPAGDLLRKLDALPGASTNDKEASEKNDRINVKDGENVHQFISWLSGIASVVNEASDGDKQLIGKLIADNIPDTPQRMSAQDHEAMISAFEKLQIFKGLAFRSGDNKTACTWEWASLSTTETSIGLLDKPVTLPPLKEIQILQAHSRNFIRIFQRMESIKCLSVTEILAEFVIPAWENGEAQAWTRKRKEEVAKLVLQHHSMLPLDSQKVLETIAFIPGTMKNGKQTSTFLKASDLIDPSNQNPKNLFFNDEACLPSDPFLNQFKSTLKSCGVKSEIDESLIHSRSHVYASKTYPPQETRQQALSLLKSGCNWNSKLDNIAFKNIKWLPVKGSTGDWELVAAKNCRGPNSKLLVSFQMPILEVLVSKEWERRFGWDKTLPTTVLLAQLSDGLQRKDRAIVDAVLTYVNMKGLLESLVPELKKLPCILTSHGEFMFISKVFSPVKEGSTSCERLHSYLGNVDNKFWDDHKKLLAKIGVGKGPEVADLVRLQCVLESKSPLNGADIAVAIELLIIESTYDPAVLTDLKVLSYGGNFFPIRDIHYNDEIKPVTGIEQFNLSHPDIPPPTIKKLGIELLSERLMRDILESEDDEDEDDEFDRKEQVTTGIVDTLTRYPIKTTFREYLANADDAQASKISWLLDEDEHPGGRLYTPELRRYQGPALLVYNNGVFSKQDFEGFKNIGEGSKRQNKNSIGQFGRGSQTMYHWTDVPMILSGESLVILDPQRKVLQKSRLHKKRKAGVILSLSKLKKAFLYDQLAPFDGLWDYKKTLDYYPGTIFRFPLRAKGDVSALKTCENEPSSHETFKYLEDYFNEARISLIFLKQISSIDFSVRGKPKSGWSIQRETPPDSEERFSSYCINCSFTNSTELNSHISGKDKWWVAISDLSKEVEAARNHQNAVDKNAECGLAALIQSGSNLKSEAFPTPSPKIFSSLPLSQEFDLPVHIHATFLLLGDRKSLVVDEYEANAEGASWNKYLLEQALPNLYLSLLETLGQTDFFHLDDYFKFWPQKCPPARSGSEIIHSSFWKQLANSSNQLFPGVDRSNPQKSELLRIDEAVFDFLPNSQTENLTSLLLSIKVSIAARLPNLIASKLRLIPELNFVTGSMLRDLFRLEVNKDKLEETFINNPKMLRSLLELTISSKEDLKGLDGCHLLPLMNGSLGVLKLLPSPRPSDYEPYYYVTDGETTDLFKFASKSLISPEYSKTFDIIANSRKFNLDTLQHCHVSRLLKLRSGPSIANAESKLWLERFWTFWNSNAELSRSLSDTLDGFNIFQATVNGTSLCLELSQMETLPALVAPRHAGHLKLCRKIPGIYLLDRKFMSVKYRESEASLEAASSFCRFIKVLRRRATHQQKALGTFVTECLNRDDLEILRRLTIGHFDKKTDELEKLGIHLLKDDLMTVPLWQSYETDKPNLIPATTALVAEDANYEMPWMKDHSRFINLSQIQLSPARHLLPNLGIKKIKVNELLLEYILPLPVRLTSQDWERYKALVSLMVAGDLSKKGSPILSDMVNSRIAANETQSPCRAYELFDHTEQIFVAAFHTSDTHFLHKDIRQFVHFWRHLRLRRRTNGCFRPADYVACIEAMSDRLKTGNIDEDEQLTSDTRVVLAPLVSPSSALDRFSDSDWTSIANEAVFVTQFDWTSEEVYRQDFMSSLAISKRLLCLSEVVSQDYISVCWSQTPFAINTPIREVLYKCDSKGKPTIEMVWRHLEHLSEMAPHLSWGSLEGYLKDLTSTYEYLANHMEEAKITFKVSNRAIWLNLDTFKASLVTLIEVQTAWSAINDLVLLSPCDSGRVKAVKPGLMQFQKLLSKLSCKSIHHPTVPQPTLHEGHSLAASLRKLRGDGELLDVAYTSEGKTIKAHRVILAAISSKCAAHFRNDLMVEDGINFDEKKDSDTFLTYHTLSTMIKYAYEDEIDWSEMTATAKDTADDRDNKLNLLLDLHGGADFWLIPVLKSHVEQKIIENSRLLINIDNVVGVRERAEDVNAKAVESFCAMFIEDNRAVVEMGEASKN